MVAHALPQLGERQERNTPNRMEGNPQKQTTALSDRELEIIGRQLPASPECFDVDDEIEFPCVK
jgi:hypothetical protein